MARAQRALDNDVPEIAAADLQTMLQGNLGENDRRAALEKLVEAFVRANQPNDAIRISNDALLRNSVAAKFWRGQALAELDRPAEALPLYHEAAAGDSAVAVRARFGEAEMLRALQRNDEAIEQFSTLFRDPQFGVRAQLRAAELSLDESDTTSAGRILNRVRPTSAADRKERHFLRGRLDLALQWPEKAIATFETILKRPRGASHSIILAALFGIADAHLSLKIPGKRRRLLGGFYRTPSARS